MTDSVKENVVASNLLHRILDDIRDAPSVYTDKEFENYLKTMAEQSKEVWDEYGSEQFFGEYHAYTDVIGYLKMKGMMEE